MIIVALLRPKQWPKNFLVMAAPIAAGRFFSDFWNVMFGVVGFISISAAGYLVNDWLDRKDDANHPIKKNRPFAKGQLRVTHFNLLLTGCISVVALSCLYLPRNFSYALVCYAVITFSYSLWIKRIPILEMFWLTFGFLVRGLGGCTIIGEDPTGWFVLTIGFSSLFVVASKRFAEFQKNYLPQTRKVLSTYNYSFLSKTVTISATMTVITYSLWVISIHANSLFALLTIFPFALTTFLILWHTENANTETPESLIWEDKKIAISLSAVIIPLIIINNK